MIEVLVVRAFVADGKGGNLAGVVLDDKGLTDEQMHSIAKKLKFSETAFVTPSTNADYRVRFFSPGGEVDLCGHATIATFFALKVCQKLSKQSLTQETRAGTLKVRVLEDGTVFMDQSLPQFGMKISKNEVADVLNLSLECITNQPQIISTGLRDIFVEIKDLKELFAMKPNFDGIRQLSEKYDTVGIHAFTKETLDRNSTAHCRNFAPRYGIDEEPATGTSNGALACYLLTNHHVSTKSLIFEQGYQMNSPSKILVHLETENKSITRVQVGGTAVIERKVRIE
ncbi:MAG: PhzF family phenazine biosynthesis protein [Bacteroidota bacterium]